MGQWKGAGLEDDAEATGDPWDMRGWGGCCRDRTEAMGAAEGGCGEEEGEAWGPTREAHTKEER